MMRKLALVAVFLMAGLASFAQAPSSFKYQAIVRNSGGAVIANQTVGIRFEIVETPSLNVVFQEDQVISTNAIGLVNLDIGSQTPDTLNKLDWATTTYRINIYLDPLGGTAFPPNPMGVSFFSAVPYSFMAFDVQTKQDIQLVGDSVLRITGNPNASDIDMSPFLDDSDDQNIFLSSGRLVLTRTTGNDTVDFSSVFNQVDSNEIDIALIKAQIAADSAALAAHIAADADTDASNELIDSLKLVDDSLLTIYQAGDSVVVNMKNLDIVDGIADVLGQGRDAAGDSILNLGGIAIGDTTTVGANNQWSHAHLIFANETFQNSSGNRYNSVLINFPGALTGGAQAGIQAYGAVSAGVNTGVDGTVIGGGDQNYGVAGYAAEASAFNAGIYGNVFETVNSDSTSGNRAVYGYTDAEGAYNEGVAGQSHGSGTSNTGVYGDALNAQVNVGVQGAAGGNTGTKYGLFGLALGNGNNYGILARSIDAVGDTNIALFARASNGTYNRSAIFEGAAVEIRNGLVMPAGAQQGYVLTTDSLGNATWEQTAARDLATVLEEGSDADNDSIYNLSHLAIGTSQTDYSLYIVDSLNNDTTVEDNALRVLATGATVSNAPPRTSGLFLMEGSAGVNTALAGNSYATSTGTNTGVWGRGEGGSISNYGIFGSAGNSASFNVGVWGSAQDSGASRNTGVYARAGQSSDWNRALVAQSFGSDSGATKTAVFAIAQGTGGSNEGARILATTTGSNTNIGARINAANATARNLGIWVENGTSWLQDSLIVDGVSKFIDSISVDVVGSDTIVTGMQLSVSGAIEEHTGLEVYANGTTGFQNMGIYSIAQNAGVWNIGGRFDAVGTGNGQPVYGMYGQASGTTDDVKRGVVGVLLDTAYNAFGTNPDDAAVYGIGLGRGQNVGVFGRANSNPSGTNYGIYGNAFGGATNWAGYFEGGNVFIQNSLFLKNGAQPGYFLSAIDTNGQAQWSMLNDNDSTNETITSFSLNTANDELSVTDNGGTNTVDLTIYRDTAAINANAQAIIDTATAIRTSIATVNSDLQTHLTGDNDLDSTNETITAMTLSNDSLVITEAGSNTSVDLSAFNMCRTLSDGDDDTRIQVEESTDEDLIRFDLGGTEEFQMDGPRFRILNTSDNIMIGDSAGATGSFGLNNTVIGMRAGAKATGMMWTTAIGNATTMRSFVSGANNVVIGADNAETATGFSNNVSIGSGAFRFGTGSENVNVGEQSLRFSTGSKNVALGRLAGYNNTGNNNTAVGYYSGASGSGSGNVYLGYQAGRTNTGSNLLFIDNSATTTPLIYGDFANDYVTINSKLGIGLTNPPDNLHVHDAGTDVALNLTHSGTGTSTIDGLTLAYTTAGFLLNYETTNFNFGTDNSIDLTIETGGEVGIGTTTPSAKLDVVGDVEIPAANDYTYATAKTQYQTVNHAAFVRAGTNTAYNPHRALSGGVYILRTQGGTLGTAAYFIAPVNLPNGATVTNVAVHYYDADATYNCTTTLRRQNYNSSVNSAMATVATSTSSGQITLNTSTITNATIDHQNYGYYLQFETTENNLNLGLYNVRITYTVTQVD
jgi:hypothetical protein